MYMKSILNYSFIVIVFSLVFVSCKKDPETTTGCNDSTADNYNVSATEDDGSCTYQKRFLGEYAGSFDCKDAFAAIFNTADIIIEERISKSEVLITIKSSIGDLPVLGIIKRDSLFVDATLTDLKIQANDINSQFPEIEIIANGSVKTTLLISSDNKILSGDLYLTLKPTSPIEYSLITLSDVCGLVATKK